MTPAANLREHPLLHSLLHTGKRDVPAMVAVRNTAAIVLPLAVGSLTGHLLAGLGISAGALNTMFADQPVPYRLRLRRMLLTALAAGVAAFAGSVLGQWPVALLLAAALWGFGAGLLVAIDAHVTRVGLTSLILLVIMGAEPHAIPEAWPAAALIFAGGVLQTLFAIAAWPLQRYRPERLALAQAFGGLADFARASVAHDSLVALPPSLNDVQALMFGVGRARGRAVEAFRVLAELAERIRLELFALAQQQSHWGNPACATSWPMRAPPQPACWRRSSPRSSRRRPRSPKRRWPLTRKRQRRSNPRRHQWKCKSRCRASRRWADSCVPPSATPTPPEAVARSARNARNSVCRGRCARPTLSRPCAPICDCRHPRFGTRCAAAFASPLRWRWRTCCRCRAAIGCR